MVNEQTPLIQTVAVASPRQRYSHAVWRRFCTIALASSLIVVLLMFMLPVALYPSPHWIHGGGQHLSSYAPWSAPFPHKSWPQGDGLAYEELQQLLVETPSEDKAKEWNAYYTSGPHTAGKNLSQAIWTKNKWQDFGVASSIVSYDVYLNYPVGHRLALLKRDDGESANAAGGEPVRAQSAWKVEFEASLEEDVLEKDGTSGLDNRIPTFHGYSANGNVTAPYVYVNYGTFEDYEDLVKQDIPLEGKIALAKYGRNFRGLKIKRAQQLGMVGVLIYSDPGDDGENTEENGKAAYPDGPARQPSSVQRGSASFLNKSPSIISVRILPGDPTTPGYPSKPGVPRQEASTIPSIPSIPISYQDALPLLKALNGHGPKGSSISSYWKGGGLGYKGVEYNVGPSPEDTVLNLVNEQEYVTTPIWDVIGVINGSIPDEVVILGNHRDAWIAGGAADPNSGSAALNEVIRSFGEALKGGWKPLRTVVFCSWDGEENNLIGSTEWVEEFLPWLSASAVAYLNVDVGVRGLHFTAAAAPLLDDLIYNATSLVQSPNQTEKGRSVRDLWDGSIRVMGSGSDFTAFQDFAGIPCVDMGFTGSKSDPVYHYHSNYDSFDWMNRFGDPDWHYHVTITKVWSLLAASLIETPLIPFNATNYAISLQRYLESVTHDTSPPPDNPSPETHTHTRRDQTPSQSFPNLTHALTSLHTAATGFDAYAASLTARLREDVPWWKWWKRVQLFYEIKRANEKYKLLERRFLHPEGLDDRPWFKHVVFAPGLWTGYSGKTLPGLVESVKRGDWENAHRWSVIIEKLVDSATASLK
ncbi:MAG: hypothetical protein M1833_002170 [Piccolia ochrophora]|nr:MAG: hypothetical protein M1833_002170 [Piccolia ochrophora]